MELNNIKFSFLIVGNSRDWGLFHRYGLQFAVTEDNTALAIGAIAIPGLMTQ